MKSKQVNLTTADIKTPLSQFSHTENYIAKENIINETLKTFEQRLIRIVKDSNDSCDNHRDMDLGNNMLSDSLVKKIARDNELRLSLARGIAQTCINIKRAEYEEYLADAAPKRCPRGAI